MKDFQSSSTEQKQYVAAVCPEYESMMDNLQNSSIRHGNDEISCENCAHWDNGRCEIFDEVLTGIDQT